MTPTQVAHLLNELFAGRVTPLQQKQVEAWLREPGHEEVYYEHLARWEAEHSYYAPDTPTALADYEQFMAGRASYPLRRDVVTAVPSGHALGRVLAGRWAWRIAAGVALLLGLYGTNTYWAYERYVAPYGQTRHLHLPDGTDVTLNAHSTLRVSRFGFSRADRTVWLEGEAYFNVAHLPNHQRFVVHTPALDVRVLGTRFNVNTRRGQTAVVLNEGRVQLVAPQAQPLLMQPGDYVALAERDTTFRKLATDAQRLPAWREGRLVFNETPLAQVARQLEDYYGVRVEVGSHELARRELTGTLPNNDLNVVLRALSVSYNVAVDRQPDKIVLR